MEPPMKRTLLMMTAAWTLSTPTQAGEMCDAALAAVTGKGPALVCAEAPLGVALALNTDRAAELARLGQAGEERFKTHFGRDPVRYAVVEITDQLILKSQTDALQAAGFTRTLPHFSHAGQRKQYEDSVRSAAVARARAAGSDGIDAGDQAVAGAAQRLTVFALNNTEATVVPHELGHGWYTQAFWPGYETAPDKGYGSPGPDWLDEAGPVLMESGDSAEQRRGIFRTLYRGEGRAMFAGYPVERLTDLRLFLTREHPVQAISQRAAEMAKQQGNTGAPVTIVMSSADPGAKDLSNIDPGLFYAQGRMFADYLIDRTGDPAIFGSIGEAFGRGETMDVWLATNGSAKNLPGSIDALTTDWRAWLAARFGAPPS
jgi:hypothetical protein